MLLRREMLGGGAALLGTGLAAPAWAQSDLRSAARDAYLYGLPILEFARVRDASLAARGVANRFTHNRTLADHTARAVTTPNNDTVYSTAFLDLRNGPVTLTLPAAGERYLSVALMDAYTNNFAVLGTRTTGTDGGTFTVVGPTSAGPPGAIRSPTPWVWALARTLVDGPADLAAANRVQDGIVAVGPASVRPISSGVGRDGDALAVLSAMARLIADNPPPATDQAVLRRTASARMDFSRVRLSGEAVQTLTAGVNAARAGLRGPGVGLGAVAGAVDGWIYPRANLGDFGEDYVYRAGVAQSGLAALPRAEAMYMRPTTRIEPGRNYRLRFKGGQLPPVADVGGFWSLTMYEVDPAGQFWLTDNPLRRYAIGDRTPGLMTMRTGALSLLFGPDDPGPNHRDNWLPAPRGPWIITMRTYLPGPDLLDGRYRLPPLEAV